MKIGIYDPYMDTLGGGERYMLTIAECLSKNNKVEIFWDDPMILEKAEKKFGINLKKVTTTKNIFSHNSNKFNRFVKSISFDRIIFLSDGSMPLLPARKTFIHFQAPLARANISSKTKAKLKATKGIIVNSFYTKKYIDEAFGKNATVIYPPVETHSFKKSAKKENKILTVGRYSPLPKGDFKKHGEMMKVFKKLVDNGLKKWSLEMVISSLPQDRKAVEELIHQTENYPIHIHTHATNDEVGDLYERAKIYWHAAGYGENLDEHPDRAEHFGIAVVEAMAAGAVPIVFEAGGLKEIIENGEVGILWKTKKELEEKTRELVHSEETRKEFASRARKEAKFYGKERFCEEIHMLLK